MSSASGIALASRGSTVLLFYAGTDQQTVYCRESTDYGATFGDAVTVTTAGSTVGWLAAAINPGNVACLFYSVGGTVYAVKRTGGTWGSPSVWTNSAAAIMGIGCVHQGDWNLAVCGQDSAGSNKVWTCVYGDGYSRSSGIWSSLAELTVASAGSNVEFRCPCLDFPDVFRFFCVEKYSGAESYSRPCWSHSLASADFIANLWREPVPFNLSSDYGIAMAHGGSYAWLSVPSGVWRAPHLALHAGCDRRCYIAECSNNTRIGKDSNRTEERRGPLLRALVSRLRSPQARLRGAVQPGMPHHAGK